MGECSYCASWCTLRKTVYDDNSEVINFQAPAGKGRCEALDIDTTPDFGCAKYQDIEHGTPTFRVTRKPGLPWQHWVMGPCPGCSGKGTPNADAPPQDGEVSARACDRCAGTSKVRYYDDGYIGEERTRMHPMERAAKSKPTCAGCSKEVERDWLNCPFCGGKLDAARPTEEIKHALSMG